MNSESLEFPGREGTPDWEALYYYRGDEVTQTRPIFTGDVFTDVPVEQDRVVTVILLQHPCALRTDGVSLTERIPVVEVVESRALQQGDWRGDYKLMPLPELFEATPEVHYAAKFTEIHVVNEKRLKTGIRVACLSAFGVNVLLQRWVYHNSRAVVKTEKYDEFTSAQYEEADAMEEWCTTRSKRGVSVVDAMVEADAWLSDTGGIGIPARELLETPQYRKRVRKNMRKEANRLNSA